MLKLREQRKKQVDLKSQQNSYSANFKRVERNVKKTARIEEKWFDYSIALEKYLTVHGFESCPDIFLNPYHYFVYYGEHLHYRIKTDFSIFVNIKNTYETLLHLPTTPDLGVENQLMCALNTYMKYVSHTPLHEILLLQFFNKNKYQFPIASYFLLDDKVCRFGRWNYGKTHIMACIAMNDEIFQLATQGYGNVVKESIPILKALKSSNILPAFEHSKVENPYYLHLSFLKKSVTLRYDTDIRGFSISSPYLQNIEELQYVCQNYLVKSHDISHLFYFTKHDIMLYNNLSLTDEIVRFLFTLTKGNYQTLIKLSLLFASIASPEILIPKLFLITYTNEDFDIKELFLRLLDYIFNFDESSYFVKEFSSISSFTVKKQVPQMLNNLFAGTKILSISKGADSLKDAQLAMMKKYIKGSRISGTDKKMGAVSFKNTVPVLCFSDNHKETAYLEQNLPCVRIDLDNIKALNELSIPHLTECLDAYEWLRTCLPLYGLYLLGEKKFYHSPFPKQENVKSYGMTDSIIEDFLKDCCIYASDSFTYTDELYQSYISYYEEEHKSAPLKRTQFVSSLKKKPGLIYKRPHISRSVPNKYAFIGICLRPGWKECISQDKYDLSAVERAFRAKLQEITNLVPLIEI